MLILLHFITILLIFSIIALYELLIVIVDILEHFRISYSNTNSTLTFLLFLTVSLLIMIISHLFFVLMLFLLLIILLIQYKWNHIYTVLLKYWLFFSIIIIIPLLQYFTIPTVFYTFLVTTIPLYYWITNLLLLLYVCNIYRTYKDILISFSNYFNKYTINSMKRVIFIYKVNKYILNSLYKEH